MYASVQCNLCVYRTQCRWTLLFCDDDLPWPSTLCSSRSYASLMHDLACTKKGWNLVVSRITWCVFWVRKCVHVCMHTVRTQHMHATSVKSSSKRTAQLPRHLDTSHTTVYSSDRSMLCALLHQPTDIRLCTCSCSTYFKVQTDLLQNRLTNHGTSTVYISILSSIHYV